MLVKAVVNQHIILDVLVDISVVLVLGGSGLTHGNGDWIQGVRCR